MTPEAPEHSSSAVSLVESWPSTRRAVEGALDVTPSSSSAVSADSSASVSTKQSIVAKRGEIIPAPLHCAFSRTVPEGSSTSRFARFSNASVVWIACWKAPSPSGASRPRAAEDSLQDRVHVQVLADPARRGERDLRGIGAGGRGSGTLRLGGIFEAAATGRRVRASRVDEHHAQRVEAAALAVEQHRRRRGRPTR